VYESAFGQVMYSESADRLDFWANGDVRVVVEAATGHVRVLAHEFSDESRWLITHPLLTLPLIELMKRHGMYSLHAAGLALGRCGVVLAGGTGDGKSTMSIALLRAGFEFQGDDMLFLRETHAGVTVLGFPDEIDLTENTVQLFPELQWIFEQPKPRGWRKWSVRVEDLYPGVTTLTAEPRALVITRVAHSDKSRLVPIRADEALIDLAPNVLLTEPAASSAHFAALGKFVRTCPAYRLDAGRDFDVTANLLRGLLEKQV
jgi:hypothetical protein